MWEELFPNEDPKKVREALDNARKWESRAKENFEKAQLVDELKTFKTESEATLKQATEKIAELESERDKLTGTLSEKDAEIARREVAQEKGIPARWVLGSTREEMEKSADDFIDDAKKSAHKPGYIGSHGTGDPKASTTPYESGRERAEARYRKNN